MRRLSQRFHVLAVDLPGHGRSPKPKQPLSIEGMAEDLYETLQKKCLLPAHFVGLSIGGMVAQMFVVKHLSSVASLTLCDTICEVNPDAAQILEERASAVEQGGMTAILEPTLERWFSPGFVDNHSDVVATVKKLLLEADPAINAQTWRAIARLNVVSRLKSAPQIPTLVVNGSLDSAIPPDAGKRLCELFDANLIELSGCAHMAPVEAPEEFMDYLESFLSGTKPG
jgi:3-oxoadipate enol-lactonase